MVQPNKRELTMPGRDPLVAAAAVSGYGVEDLRPSWLTHVFLFVVIVKKRVHTFSQLYITTARTMLVFAMPVFFSLR